MKLFTYLLRLLVVPAILVASLLVPAMIPGVPWETHLPAVQWSFGLFAGYWICRVQMIGEENNG